MDIPLLLHIVLATVEAFIMSWIELFHIMFVEVLCLLPAIMSQLLLCCYHFNPLVPNVKYTPHAV